MSNEKKYLDEVGLAHLWDKVKGLSSDSDYVRIEYLESHANGQNDGPYIDTGLTLTSECTITMDVQITNLSNHTNLCLFGSRSSAQPTKNDRSSFGYSSYLNNFRFDYAKANNTVAVSNPYKRMIVSKQRNRLYIDNELKNAATHASFTLPGSMILFAQRTTDNPTQIAETINMKMYSCDIIDGDIQAHYIPCKKRSTGEIGLFETVSGMFYTNSGSELEFTAGPEIVDSEPEDPEAVLSVEKGGTGQTTVDGIRTMLFNFPEEENLTKYLKDETSTLNGDEVISASNLKSIIPIISSIISSQNNAGKFWFGASNGYSYGSSYNDRCSFVETESLGITYRSTDSRFILPGPCNLKVHYTMEDFHFSASQASGNCRVSVGVNLMSGTDNTKIGSVFNNTYYDLHVMKTIDITKTFNNITDNIVWFQLVITSSGYYSGSGRVDYSKIELTTV